MVAGELHRLLKDTSMGVIRMWLVRFALQWSRKHRMHDGMVRMGRIAVIVLDLRMHVHPGHHEQPERNPEEKGSARPGRTFTHR